MKELIKKLLSVQKNESKQGKKPSVADEFDTQIYWDFNSIDKEIYRVVKSLTMTSPERVKALLDAIFYVESSKLEGDFVECGVWKGGSTLAAAKMFEYLHSYHRKLWLFDTFEGMSAPTKDDVDLNDVYAENRMRNEDKKTSNIWAYSELEEVKHNLGLSAYPQDRFIFVKGKVEDTLKKDYLPDKISILRLDTDWYESTLIEMEILYPRVVKGGIIIVDDYGHWKGSKKAVDEYFKKQGLNVFLNRIDYTGRLIVKY
jgi:hypothetical protein